MQNGRIKIFCLYLGLGLSCSSVQLAKAKTWSVERDGTGDFTIIQDAVDAAASGDTILVGPGRFDEKRLVTTPGWTEYVRVQVMQEELTIIGSGPETIIGQENPWDSGQGHHKGIASGDSWGNAVLRVESLQLENMRDALYTSYEFGGTNFLEVRACSFSGNEFSLFLIGNNGTVEVSDCTFNNMSGDGVHVAGWGHNEVTIRKCAFGLGNEIYGQQAVGLMNVQEGLIEDCSLIGGTTGISVSGGGPVMVKGCIFNNQGNLAIFPSSLSTVAIDSCNFSNQTKVIRSLDSGNEIAITNSVVQNVVDCSFWISYTGSFSVNNCDLAKGGWGVVVVEEQPSCAHSGRIDMTNNYWGTDSPDSIRAWIHDRNDSEDACYYVDFEPYSDVPLPTEKKSLGGLKSLYR